MGYWGDGNLDTSKKGYVGGVKISVFKEFGLISFAERLLGINLDNVTYENDIEDEISEEDVSTQANSSPELLKSVINPEENKDFENFLKILSEWHYDKKSFTKAYQVRDEISKFVISNIAWQQEGVPLVSVQMVEKSSYDLVEIERQDKKAGKGLVFLKDDDETYQLLLAIGKSFYLGKKRVSNVEYASWDFEGATSSLRVATCWLEKNKKKFVDVVKAYDDTKKYPDYLKCSIIAEVYRGLLSGDYHVNKISDLKTDFLLNGEISYKKELYGHSKEWNDLVDFMYSLDASSNNIDTIHRYFNLIQGRDRKAKKKIINYNLLDNVFKELKSEKFEIDINAIESDKIKDRNKSKEYLRKILSKVEKAVSSEIEEGKELYRNVLKYFGFSDDVEIEIEDVIELMNEVKEFYRETETYGINIPIRSDQAMSFKNRSAEIMRSLAVFNTDLNGMSIIDKLILYSSNPMKIMKEFTGFMELVDKDNTNVYSEVSLDKEKLTRSGAWSDDIDPRFKQNESEFQRFIKLLGGLTCYSKNYTKVVF